MKNGKSVCMKCGSKCVYKGVRMETIYDFKSTIPFSLHDMRICKIEVIDETIKLHFENGFVETKEPYKQMDGQILIEGADFDFCEIQLLSKYGRLGKFRGEKMELTDFIKKYKEFSFEVVDEMYGYNQVYYSGYLSLPKKRWLREMQMSVYYTGNIIYVTESTYEG